MLDSVVWSVRDGECDSELIGIFCTDWDVMTKQQNDVINGTVFNSVRNRYQLD